MIKCDKLIHPFQNDPGISQDARAAAALLSNAPKIDGRTLADLLDFFQQLSKNVNFYQTDKEGQLVIGDWQPFFRSSIPFTLASIIKYKKSGIQDRLQKYQEMFRKNPSPKSLQLILHFIYNKSISSVSDWSAQLRDSGLPVRAVLEKLIRDRLSQPVKQFICLCNSASAEFNIKRVNFNKLIANPDWQLKNSHFHAKDCFNSLETSKRKRLIALQRQILQLVPVFMESLRLANTAAELSINASLEPVKEELKQKHPPHLALLFAFLKLFGYLQTDLNGFTRKHLDFFYREVLRLQAKDAVPDRAHLIIEIQDQLAKYKVNSKEKVKAGKDSKKTEIMFELENEIIVNKTKVADLRTLYLNTEPFLDKSYVEGIYMAPNALMANGVDIDFKDDEPKSWATLGAKYSKYSNPEHKFIVQYPQARVGFILASPVLFLKEGKREIDLVIVCELEQDLCANLPVEGAGKSNPCCEDLQIVKLPCAKDEEENIAEASSGFVKFWEAEKFHNAINLALQTKYYRITITGLTEAVKKGLRKEIVEAIKKTILADPAHKLCYCPIEDLSFEKVLTEQEWKDFQQLHNATDIDKLLLGTFFKPERLLNISLSGEKGWIVPPGIDKIEFLPLQDNKYAFRIEFILEDDIDPVTFFNSETLEEEIDTSLPVLKVELNDSIKLQIEKDDLLIMLDGNEEDDCCMKKKSDKDKFFISFYQFLRNLIVIKTGVDPNDPQTPLITQIDVHVTGLKNFIVHNDEGVQDVNAPILTFGITPKVGSSFLVGSGEIFSKNWQHIKLRGEWKDHPGDLKEYYKFYGYDLFENSIPDTENFRFLIAAAVRERGLWKLDGTKRLFKNKPSAADPLPGWRNHEYDYDRTEFALSSYIRGNAAPPDLKEFTVNSRDGFLRLTLEGISFQHHRYAFELARRMMTLAELVDPVAMLIARAIVDQIEAIKNAINNRIQAILAQVTIIDARVQAIGATLTGIPATVASIIPKAVEAHTAATNGDAAAVIARMAELATIITNLTNAINQIPGDTILITNATVEIINLVNFVSNPFDVNTSGIADLLVKLNNLIAELKIKLGQNAELLGLPREPYTPAFKTLVLDYHAIAEMDDIDLIHLHPYKNTYNALEFEARPTLFPTICSEGQLYIGLEGLVPGSNLNILFQLAEATADSEAGEQEVRWHYLENNQWKLLRNGFEVLKDDTDDLTTSGIIQFSLPENMTRHNSILPKNLHWIRASVPTNSRALSEVIGIHPQAVSAIFLPDASNDLLRLDKPLAVGSINRLSVADANIKLIDQPYESVGGQVPEIEKKFYTRVSELLRHKGRAIQKWDYERLTLEAFPEVFKAKCLNHTLGLSAHEYTNDFPMAAGYVTVAVIPDLRKLKAGKSFQPKLPVSIILKIEDYLKKRSSAFVRINAKNPRYEEVDFCFKVKFYPDKDLVYYKEKLRTDVREYLAPWAVGEYEKLRFGQCINRSDLVQFLEGRDYLDHIIDMRMSQKGSVPTDVYEICPLTARSILIAGEIDICVPEKDCDDWLICCEDEKEIDCCPTELIPVAELPIACKQDKID